jgi:ubiquitin C-terminal hydrolase
MSQYSSREEAIRAASLIQPQKFIQIDSWQPKDFQDNPELKARKLRYRLVGVLYHSGVDIIGGHYVAAFKHPTRSKWMLADDTECNEVNFSEVLRGTVTRELPLCGPYIFVYSLVGERNYAKV